MSLHAANSTEHDVDRSHYQVTFAVLAVSISAYALLQSLVLPVLPDHPARACTPRRRRSPGC